MPPRPRGDRRLFSRDDRDAVRKGALIEVADFRTESRARPPPLSRATLARLCFRPNNVHPPRIPGTDGRKVLKAHKPPAATNAEPAVNHVS
jgi:hypothetical protein